MHRRFVFVLCALSASASAQSSGQSAGSQSSEAYWNIALTPEQQQQSRLVESQTSIPDPISPLNTVVVQQNGSANRAVLQTVGGSQNLLEATQASNGNAADALLSGSNNSLIINQSGGSNALNLDLTGNNNRYLVTQDGGDAANLQGLQHDNTRLELVQGSGNNLFTVDNTPVLADPSNAGIPNLRIEQTGGAALIIQQGRAIGSQP